MKEPPKKFWEKNPKISKVFGMVFIIIGLFSLITPFTPLGILFFIGLEFLGVRTKYWQKLKIWVEKTAKNL